MQNDIKNTDAEWILQRAVFEKAYTEGWLSVDGIMFCDTLEDRVRDFDKDGDLDSPGEEKVYGKTAIPFGRYEIKLTFSPRFQKIMPELLKVKEFTGIRMHSGTRPEHTLGCILVGKYNKPGTLLNDHSNERLIKILTEFERRGRRSFITVQ